MTIQNLLSLNYLLPYVAHKLDFTKAVRGLRGMPRRVLLIGHVAASGAAAPIGTITKAIGTESDALAYCGEGSMLMAMWRAAAGNMELGGVIDILPLATASGAAKATATLTIAGAPTQAGEVMVHIAGVRVSVGASLVDTATDIATRLTTAINALTALPVVATSSAGVITLEARWGGASCNDIDVRGRFYRDDIMALGVTLTVAAMSGGATNPDLSAYVLAASNYRATEIVCPFNDSTSMGILEAEQETRWGCTNQQDGQVITVKRGALAAHLTWLQPRNSKQVHSIHVRNDRTTPWETAAMAGAAIESSAAIDAVVPYTGIKLKGYMGPADADVWDERTDANNLALLGGSVIEANEDGTGNLLRMFTHYKRSPSGANDQSCRELCWVKIASYWRWFRTNEFETKYRDGWKADQYATEVLSGQKIMTKELVQEICVALYMIFVQAGWFTFAQHFIDTMVIEFEPANGKFKIDDEPVMVLQHYQTEFTSHLLSSV
jgi:phage tail sheath gpL-like